MRWATRSIGIFVACAALGVACAAGCVRRSDDERESRDRYLRRAIAAKNAENVDEAIRLCEKALDRRPRLALAHRELGLMLDNYRQDYPRALYHYARYLELRPDSPQREDVAGLIEHCRTSFAAQVAQSPGELQRGLKARNERIRNLEREVAALREQAGVSASGPAPAPSAASAQVAPAVPAAAAAPEAESASERIHVVQVGETLGAISTRYYGSPAQWIRISKANRLVDANNVRVGTRLTIPSD